MMKTRLKFSPLACAALALFPLSSVAYAQTAPADADADAEAGDDAGDTIVVTANRREESAQKVGIAVTALAPQMLENGAIIQSSDIAKLVPALNTIPNAGSPVTAYSIRGVSLPDGSAQQESPIALYQDGVYVANTAAAGFPVFDLQRVEALRGPQGTLFGRNATGGLIQFISNKPEEGFSAQIEGSLGSYELRQLEGFVNFGNDVIAVRVAGSHLESDGFINNTLGRNLLTRNVDALRIQVRFEPNPDTVFTLRAEGFDQKGTARAGKHVATWTPPGALYPEPLPADVDAWGGGPGNDLFGYRDTNPDPYTVEVNRPGFLTKNNKTLALTYEQALGIVSLNSTTAYTRTKVGYLEDSDAGPTDSLVFATGSDVDTFSQELRFQADHGGFRWTAGGYYIKIDGDYDGSFTVPEFFGFSTRSQALFNQTTRSFSLFAQGEYDLTDRLTFILGGRYQWDKNELDLAVDCIDFTPDSCAVIFPGYSDGAPGTLGTLRNVAQQQKNDDWSGKVGLNFQATQDLLFYVSASKGLKGGGWTISPDGTSLVDRFGFGPEKLYAYEGGVKTTLADGKVTANLSAFYYDYKGAQTYFFSGVTATVFNQNATNKGFEVEVNARPWRGGNIGFNVAYADPMAKGIVTPEGVQSQRPTLASKWQVGWNAGQSIDLSDRANLYLGYVAKYTSNRYFNIVNEPLLLGRGYTVHDLNAKLTLDDRYWISVFASNVTDKKYVSAIFSQAPQGYALLQYAEPRVIGLRVGAKF